ncbi:unnamed protein product [Sphagnum troendelagicum]|uniref:Retrotransposon gag domain-containing protein n=1 Tax=Sphagnum troendelagicum TaxID=128251 RepID=A0ABP0T6R6_9BRYO
MTSAILLQTQKERYRNLQQFTGNCIEEVDEYISKIESIGALTKEPEATLHILLKTKLSGPAELWYEDNQATLDTWPKLRAAIQHRFQQPMMIQKLIFILDHRKHEENESVDNYCDDICRLCRRIDFNMSKQMILYFLQKGIRDSMRTNIVRAMLRENDHTPETFLKIARIESQLKQTDAVNRQQSLSTNSTTGTSSYLSEQMCLTSSLITGQENIRYSDCFPTEASSSRDHVCYVCHQQYLMDSDLHAQDNRGCIEKFPRHLEQQSKSIQTNLNDNSSKKVTDHMTTEQLVVSILESRNPMDNEPQYEQQIVNIDPVKNKRSCEAINRRGRKHNTNRRKHRHDYDIIRTIDPRFRVKQIEQILDDLHLRYRHCHIRRHYQLHIGVNSQEDQTQYERLLHKKFFTKERYDELFGQNGNPLSNQHLDES